MYGSGLIQMTHCLVKVLYLTGRSIACNGVCSLMMVTLRLQMVYPGLRGPSPCLSACWLCAHAHQARAPDWGFCNFVVLYG